MIGTDQLETIRNMVGAGKSDRTIAMALGVSKGVVSGTIHRHCMRSGGVSAIKIRREWTAEEMAQIHALIAAGASLYDIGKAVGLARETVRCRFKRMGLTTNPSARRGGRKVRAAPGPRRRKAGAAKKRAHPAVKLASADCAVPVVISLPKAVTPVVAQTGYVGKCAWLHGTRRNYIACDQPTAPSKSWCPEHAAICLVGWNDCREHDSQLTAAA